MGVWQEKTEALWFLDLSGGSRLVLALGLDPKPLANYTGEEIQGNCHLGAQGKGRPRERGGKCCDLYLNKAGHSESRGRRISMNSKPAKDIYIVRPSLKKAIRAGWC